MHLRHCAGVARRGQSCESRTHVAQAPLAGLRSRCLFGRPFTRTFSQGRLVDRTHDAPRPGQISTFRAAVGLICRRTLRHQARQSLLRCSAFSRKARQTRKRDPSLVKTL